MKINRKIVTQYLDNLDFESLFIEELRWDYPEDETDINIIIEETLFKLIPIAEKRKFVVYQCALNNQCIPSTKILQKVDQEFSKYKLEHLLIYTSHQEKKQIWQWMKKEGNQRPSPRLVEYSARNKRVLLDSLENITFSLAEEKNLNLLEVKERTKKAFDIEKVTKKFFTEFQQQHLQFVEFINGIDDIKDKNWYASVILNRLMFVYFLQKKGFLDNGNKDYLQDKLKISKNRGENLYYQEFLASLFFQGFAKREYQRSETVKQLIGKIKYLNGGLFLPHHIESKYQNSISIKDSAFEQIFQLFSSYTWHLDDTPTGNENEINPDVLGYIFEKYINQKAFGAYYTKPEITNYLCAQTIDKFIREKLNFSPSPVGEIALTPNPSPIEEGSLEKEKVPLFKGDLGGSRSGTARSKNQNDPPLPPLLKGGENTENDDICNRLLDDILPNLSILDPACGSGAFLVASLQYLITIYQQIFSYISQYGNEANKTRLSNIKQSHPSLEYYIKKRIITDNLYGVDIMAEATEIAKLRLFLSLVASAETVDDLEPLPNVDFNIMSGNSLIGLIRVDEGAFDSKSPSPAGEGLGVRVNNQGNLLNLLASSQYQKILAEKNKSIKKYKEHAFNSAEIEGTDQDSRLQMLRDHIEKVNKESTVKLNQLLLDEFTLKLGIKYEEVQLKGKPIKRNLTIKDIEALMPFHWGYHFDKIITKGGFDIILGNPPWEVFQTDEKEFFQQFDNLIQKKKLDIKAWKTQFNQFMKDDEMQKAWLNYCSNYPHVSAYFKNSEQYKNQISLVNGRNASRKINLYALFLEQCVNLLAKNGQCGIVIPSGIYTDLGTKQLREMLFSLTTITGLFCFENRKAIFEGVHKSFKFVILSFEKKLPSPPTPLPQENLPSPPTPLPQERGESQEGVVNQCFPARFMRHDVAELTSFFDDEAVIIDVGLVRRLSPDSLSIMEFKGDLDIEIAKKMARFPLLGEEIKDCWNLKLKQEFNMTSDSNLFYTEPAPSRLPLYEGKMIHQFTHNFAPPKYWLEESEARQKLLGKKGADSGQLLDYQCYRLGFRDIARNTDQRTLIATIDTRSFHGNKLPNAKIFDSSGNRIIDNKSQVFLCGIFNSFVLDWILRQSVTTTINFFYIYQLPVPRLREGDKYFDEIVECAGKLICTTAEYDDLAREIGLSSVKKVPLFKGDLGGSQSGAARSIPNKNATQRPSSGDINTSDPPQPPLLKGGENAEGENAERENLRAEIDGMVAHLYGLNEREFRHILSTFPLVDEAVKGRALGAFLSKM
ncbi:MAG: ATP-binding protein [Cyanobacterium sp. T60_A2020_053]|nr:ATP-binding protein [Cyanobacterium sp. T60_A2020_053]